MTVVEFEEINNYDDLETLCRDYNLEGEIADYYTEHQFKEDILERIYEYYQDDDLSGIVNLCNDLPGNGYERYYYHNGYYYGTDDRDDTFEQLKDDIRSIFENNDWFDEEEDEVEDVYYESLENDESETILSEPVDIIDIADIMSNLSDIGLTTEATEQTIEPGEVVGDNISFENFDAALNHRESNTETNDEPSEEINENITELIGGI